MARRRRRVARHVGAAALVVLVALGRAHASERQVDPADAAAVVLEMIAAVPEDDVEARYEIVERLSALDPERRPALLVAYGAVAGDPPGMRRRALVEMVFKRLGAAAVLELLRPYAAADATPTQRAQLYLMVRDLDLPGALPLVIDAALNTDPAQLERPFVLRGLRGALAAAARRDDVRGPGLRAAVERAPRRVQETLLDVIAEVDPTFGTRSLSALLGVESALDRDVVGRLLRMPLRRERPLAAGADEALVRMLADADPAGRRLAALAIARFGVAAQAPRLVELLADPDPAVGRAAHRALESLSGTHLQPTQELWTAWLEAEDTWSAQHLDETLTAAREGERFARLRALTTLGRHPYLAEAIVPQVGAALNAEDAAVRRAACVALGALRSPTALRALLERTEDADATVVAAASAALERISGLDAPKRAADWVTLLAERR